jgi:hypothetical protein
MTAYKNQCQSVLVAPLPWKKDEVADHQCSGTRKPHTGKHFCGCGIEWTDVEAVESVAAGESADRHAR